MLVESQIVVDPEVHQKQYRRHHSDNALTDSELVILLDLAIGLTDKEIAKLARISELVKGSDIMKAKDMICRIIGAYEPDKIEVVDRTYKVGFDLGDSEPEILA